MNKIATIKLVARIVVGIGTTTISNSIISNNVQPTNLIQQISVGAASLVVGSMASEAAKSHTDAQIDGLVSAWKSNMSNEAPAT